MTVFGQNAIPVEKHIYDYVEMKHITYEKLLEIVKG